jgi:hypothetical protein
MILQVHGGKLIDFVATAVRERIDPGERIPSGLGQGFGQPAVENTQIRNEQKRMVD